MVHGSEINVLESEVEPGAAELGRHWNVPSRSSEYLIRELLDMWYEKEVLQSVNSFSNQIISYINIPQAYLHLHPRRLNSENISVDH